MPLAGAEIGTCASKGVGELASGLALMPIQAGAFLALVTKLGVSGSASEA